MSGQAEEIDKWFPDGSFKVERKAVAGNDNGQIRPTIGWRVRYFVAGWNKNTIAKEKPQVNGNLVSIVTLDGRHTELFRGEVYWTEIFEGEDPDKI